MFIIVGLYLQSWGWIVFLELGLFTGFLIFSGELGIKRYELKVLYVM